MKNVVVMTEGLAGSSVLTGLVARAGYWMGHQTVKKKDYDTNENARLIELNQALFELVGFDGEYSRVFPGWVIDALESKFNSINPSPYKEFIADCERNGPWIWKDPRLNLTMRIWARWLDLDNVSFLMISREQKQSWIALTLRKQIQTYSYHAAYNDRVRRAIQTFFDGFGVKYLPIVYEDLMVYPENSIAALNEFLNTQLTVADLEAIYVRQLYQRQHGVRSMAKALLIYLKNYRERRFLDHTP